MKYIEHTVIEHICSTCDLPLGDHEGNPCVEHEGEYYCCDCGFKQGYMSSQDYLISTGVRGFVDDVLLRDGRIVFLKKRKNGYQKMEVEE